MKRNFRLIIPVIFFLASCSSHQKKILIYANSPVQVDESGKNITLVEGNSQYEKELDFSGSEPVVLHITAPSGQFTVEANDDGLWIANLKKDAIVGSRLHIGETKQTRITQEQLKIQLDSLNQLVKGQNVSPEKGNYFIPSQKAQKITSEMNSKVFPPFTPVPSAFDAGSYKAVFKFYTLSEENEIINKLIKLSTYQYPGSDSSSQK